METQEKSLLAKMNRLQSMILEIDGLAQDMELIDSIDEDQRKLAAMINDLTVLWLFPERTA